MANLTDNCLSCHQTYYQQSLLPLEYVDFTFGGQQISLIGCFVESSTRPIFYNGPKICLTCLERLQTCHMANNRVPVSKRNVQKLSYPCVACHQLNPVNNLMNLRLTVVNANGRQVNLEECIRVCWKIELLTSDNLTICLSCVSAIVEEYILMPEFMEIYHADVKVEPNIQESLKMDYIVEQPLEVTELDVSNLKKSPDPLTRQREAPELIHLKCSKCPLKFESTEQTVQHENDIHPIAKQFECGICGSGFKRKRNLTDHVKKHRSNYDPTKRKKAPGPLEVSVYKCNRAGCTKVCRSNHTLNQHVQQIHEGFGIAITCRLCDVVINCRQKFKVHLTRHTMPNGQLRCENCTEVFEDYADTRNHLHDSPVPYECHHCKYTSPHLALLHRHLWTYHFRKEFKCRLCGEVLDKYLLFKRHMSDHKRASLNLQCDVCQKKFLIQKSFNYHCNRWQHVFPCAKCDVRCHTLGKLEVHMRLKHNEFFPCHICNQPFRDPSTMQKHLKRLHGVIPKSKCRICGLTFDSPAELTAHKVNDHKKVMKTKYVCEHCGQGFDGKSSLAKHVQRHKTARDYACKECNRVYKTPQSLSNHVQTIHLRVKNRKSTNMVYTCPKCPQWKFGRHQALEGHMIVHNTENRAYFQCNYCGIAYTRRQKFDVHIKICPKGPKQ